MTPPLITALNLPVKGARPPVLRACKMVIGLELDHLKRELGFEGSGARASFQKESAGDKLVVWKEFCRAQAGITDDTAKNYLVSAKALKNRLSGSAWKNAKWLIGQMDKRPSELTESERANMIECIAGEVFDSPATLLVKEFRAVEACNIPESLPEARAKVLRAQAMLKVMQEELRKREEQAKVRLVLKALSGSKAAGTLQRFLKP